MSDRRIAGLLSLAALLARLLAYFGTPMFGTDGAAMLRQADAFAEGRYADAMGPYHPLYPFLASWFQPLFGAERSAFWVSIILGSAAAAPLYLAARSVVGRWAAFVGGLFYAFHPHLVELQADVMTEGTFMFFLFAAIWLGTETVDTPRWWTAVLAGLSAGAAFLTRPEGLIVLVGIPCWILASIWKGRWGIRLLTVAIFAAGPMVLMLPYIALVGSLSKKESFEVVVGEKTRAVEADPETGKKRDPYRDLGRNLIKVSYIVFIPLMLLGIPLLRRQWRMLVYFSFPVLYWIAIAWATSRNPSTSYRYLLPGLALFLPLCGLGLSWLRASHRQWAALAVLAICLVRVVPTNRMDERPYREAAAWIRMQQSAPRVMTTTDKIAYLSGGKWIRVPKDWSRFESLLTEVDYVVLPRKDLKYVPAIERIRDRLGEPIEVGTTLVWRVRP